MRGLEWASGKNPLSFTGAIFVISAQAVDLLQENSCTYGVSVSELTIFGYVEGDPVTYIDPEGLIVTDPWWGYTDPKFQDWWHSNKKKGPWFSDSDEGFNRKKPYDIPNKECADRVKSEYDRQMEERENVRKQKGSNGPRPERGRGSPKPKFPRGGGGGRGWE